MRRVMRRRVMRSREKNVRGQLPSMMRLAIVHRMSPATSERELQLFTEPSCEARDTAPPTTSSATANGPNSDGASRIGVDTVRNHFHYAPTDASTQRVDRCGSFCTGRCPLVLFPQDFIPVQPLDQWTEYPTGPQVLLRGRATFSPRPLPGREDKILSPLYPAARPRS